MKNWLAAVLLLLTVNFSFITSVFTNDIKIQRVASTGTENNSITQDKDGILWIGVWGKGLFCYNGTELTKAKIGNGENPVPVTWSIFTDSEGIIWYVVADHGLYSYDKTSGTCKEYKAETGNSDTLISNYFNVIIDIHVYIGLKIPYYTCAQSQMFHYYFSNVTCYV